MTTAELTRSLAKLKPGAVFTLPDGDILGNIKLPRGLSGTKGKPITIQGGKDTVIRATSKKTAAISGGGNKYLTLASFGTVGGRNGVQISQNGLSYEKMIEGILLYRIKTRDSIEDGIKLNGGRDAHVAECDVEGGDDQGIDFLGIDGGSIIDTKASGLVAIVLKGGTRRVTVARNALTGVDGLKMGDITSAAAQAPWTPLEAVDCVATENKIAVTGRPIVMMQQSGCSESGNAMTTTKRVKGQPAPLVVVLP